jgi:hypothetical protein
MEDYKKQFVSTLKKFMTDLQSTKSSKGIDKVLTVFDKLDPVKVSKKVYKNISKYSEKIKAKDDSLFNESVVVLPDVDVTDFWSHASKNKKDKFWVYLNMLLILSELLVKNLNTKNTSNNSKNNTQNVESFNPYEGVGNDNNEEYGVDDMFTGVDKLDPSKVAPSLTNLAGLVGLDKMLNLDELTKQLQNMDENDIDEATKNINSMLGDNIDESTTSTISEMLSSISKELKNNDMKSGNLFENLSNIANVVADKMQTKINSGDVNVADLWASTKTLASKCKTGSNDSVNPVEFLSGMMEKQYGISMGQDVKNDNENVVANNMTNDMPNDMTNDDYQKVLQNMGLTNIDVTKLDDATKTMLEHMKKK